MQMKQAPKQLDVCQNMKIYPHISIQIAFSH